MVISFMRIAIALMFSCVSFLSSSQVNLQTGSPQISIPLYGIADANNGLSTSVSLKYVGGNGIKVDNIASSVGTGWEIAFGGSITRIQHGEPDDQKQRKTYYPFTSPSLTYDEHRVPTDDQINSHTDFVQHYYPNGLLYSTFNAATPVNNGGSSYYLSTGGFKDLPDPYYLADREMDIFNFEFNGRSGSFSIAKTATRDEVFTYNLKDSKLKIKVEHDLTLIDSKIRTTIKKITITDENGIQYIYEDMELTEVIKYDKMETYNSNGSLNDPFANIAYFSYVPVGSNHSTGSCVGSTFPVMRGVRTGEYVCNRWMLSKIINLFTNRSINFTYTEIPLVLDGPHLVTKTSSSGTCSFSTQIELISQKLKRLISISNQYSDRIDLKYGDDRKDLIGDKVLSDVNFYKQGNYLSSTHFEFGYFCKYSIRGLSDVFTDNENSFLRLCLKQVQKFGINNSTEPPYKFFYEIDDNNSNLKLVPPRFCYFKDLWGYFNGSQWFNEMTVCQNIPLPGHPYLKDFYNEAFRSGFHDINNLSLYNSHGLINSITYPQGSKLDFQYEQNIANSNSINVSMGGVRVKQIKVTDPIAGNVSTTSYKYVIDDVNNKSSGWGYELPIFAESKQMLIRRCGNNQTSFPIYSIGQSITSAITVVHSGEAAIIAVDPTSAIISLAIDIILPALLDLFTSDTQEYTQTTTFSNAVNQRNPLPFLYSRVEVKNTTNNIQSGTDIYEFTSPSDYPLEIANYSQTITSRQRLASWKYGLLKKMTNKSANDNVLKAIEYYYDPLPFQQQLDGDDKYLSRTWKAGKILTRCSPLFPDDGFTDAILQETYKPFIGKIDLLETREYVYNNHGNIHNPPTINTTSFEYNSNFLTSKKTVTNSKGEQIETLYKYPDDFSLTGAISTLKNNNNISTPVSTETYIYKGGVKKLLSGSIIEYGTLADGNIKPVKTYSLITDRPIDDNTVTAFSPSQLVRDPAYYKPVAEMKYDGDGNLVQTNKLVELNSTISTPEKVSMIADKLNPELIIATASNASYTDIAYTSFETPADINNWNYNDALVSADDGVTGTRCFEFDAYFRSISKIGLNSSGKYKLSFWCKTDGTRYFLPLVKKNSPNSNGIMVPTRLVYTNPVTFWKLYEADIDNTSSVYIMNDKISSPSLYYKSGLLDEIRLMPEGATMNTATYNIQGLKTSTADQNNKIQYMEYDGLGRLRLTRDEERNILKTYEYNYKQ